MARQDSLIQLRGRIGDLSFYKSREGYFVRRKSGVSRDRIMSDPAYARTRENISEFRNAVHCAKLLRAAFTEFLNDSMDSRMSSRLTGAIAKAARRDVSNPPGERNITDGEVSLLEGFQFNKYAKLSSTWDADFHTSISRTTGEVIVDIPAFTTATLINSPKGATHFRFRAAAAVVDFKANNYFANTSQTGALLITDDQPQSVVRLIVRVPPSSAHTVFVALGIEFLNETNGSHYPLSDRSVNAMAIVKIDANNSTKPSPVKLNEQDQASVKPKEKLRITDKAIRVPGALKRIALAPELLGCIGELSPNHSRAWGVKWDPLEGKSEQLTLANAEWLTDTSSSRRQPAKSSRDSPGG